jgi:magnesium transporter
MLDKITNNQHKVIWIDLCDPTQSEINEVEKEFDLHIPSRHELEEIETSSRLQFVNHFILVNLPSILHVIAEEWPAPVGFILNAKILITIRFQNLPSFETAKQVLKNDKHKGDPADAFAHILEQMIEVGADILEKISHDTTNASHDIFNRYSHANKRMSKRSQPRFRTILYNLGNYGENLSQIRSIQLGLQRIIPFVLENGQSWMSQTVQTRLKTVLKDLESLIDFELHLANRIQFLLDAVLGFTNTEQNDIFKVLTIVSVIGIPPTFIASWYGMNFHFMPEYAWIHGYFYVIFLTTLSIIIPLIWFIARGWL